MTECDSTARSVLSAADRVFKKIRVLQSGELDGKTFLKVTHHAAGHRAQCNQRAKLRALVGRETGTPAPLSALTREMVASALAMFGSDADHTEMAKLCERLVGTQLGRADTQVAVAV